MYTRFPYPSVQRGETRLTELANLLRLFAAETAYDFRDKSVLDVGTGTGHRLIAAALRFPDTRFVAVDFAERPLEIARATAAEAGVTNVTFLRRDLLADNSDLGRFDVVLCMGVLHHLESPSLGLHRLSERLSDDGVLFAYLYGSPGSAERMRRKEMLSLMIRRDGASIDAGVAMARHLGFDTSDYGWNRNADDARSRDALIVDSYLNVQETLYDVSGIEQLMRASDLDRFMVYGVTTQARGLLFESSVSTPAARFVHWTDMRTILRDRAALATYERLSLRERYRMIELTYQPNGYTVLAYRRGADHLFATGGRIARNALPARLP